MEMVMIGHSDSSCSAASPVDAIVEMSSRVWWTLAMSGSENTPVFVSAPAMGAARSESMLLLSVELDLLLPAELDFLAPCF